MIKVTTSGLLFSLLVSASMVLSSPLQAHSEHDHAAQGPRWHSGLSIQYHYPPHPVRHHYYGHPHHKPRHGHGHRSHHGHGHGHGSGHGGRKIIKKYYR